MRVVNSVFGESAKGKLHMTMCFLSLDLKTGDLYFASAGHPAPLWYSQENEKVKRLVAKGNPLGYKPEIENVNIVKVKLTPGDSIFAFTDGIYENVGPEGKAFKVSKFKKIFANQERPLQEVHDEIMDTAKIIWQDQEADDDVATVSIRWAGPIDEQALLSEAV